MTLLHATTANACSTFSTSFLSAPPSPSPSPSTSTSQSFFSHSHTLPSLLQLTQKWRHHLSLATRPLLKDGIFTINGKEAFKDVPHNVVLTPLTDTSVFLGATASHSTSRHIFKLGLIKDARFVCLFRFKLWWMIPRFGRSASDIPTETQMLLLEAKEQTTPKASDHTTYILFLPVLDGKFRSSLQGNSSDELEFCVESGDPAIVASETLKAIFVNYGNHPFDLVKDSMMILKKQLGTFALRETKQMPGMLDWFGWCTWDAFYTKVNPQGIKDGLMSLSQGGTPAKFLIIDDGWQDTVNEFQKEGEPFVDGSQFGGRLASIRENNKFRRSQNESKSKGPSGLKEFVSDIKRTFDVEYVYVWHALLGYWGGLVPNLPETKKYDPKLKYPMQSRGNLANLTDISINSMEKYGIGVIDPDKISQFYDDLHGYLVSQEVDGVKVDVQNILETISQGLGGRVSLARQFQQALERSIAANFKDNSIICCMAQSTDSIYHAKQSAVARASDDYFPENPELQTQHIAAVAFNSIFLGEVFVPDWDMFYSLHDAAEFHAVARAVGGCGVYVCDKPGKHDFKILKRLVLGDGSVLRAKYTGRPSRDCLFSDPVMDGKSLLKIWNLNKCTGVVGVFNCQGAGIWPCSNKKAVEVGAGSELSGKVSPADVEYFEEEVSPGKLWTGECAVYSFKTGAVSRLAMKGSIHVALKTLECDVFTISPINEVYKEGEGEAIEFAAMGLMNMYNSGGAVESVSLSLSGKRRIVHVKGRGAGCFAAYSNTNPNSCSINLKQEVFNFNAQHNLLTIPIPVSLPASPSPTTTSSWDIAISYD